MNESRLFIESNREQSVGLLIADEREPHPEITESD
jgi:hypothetical protein